MTVPAWTAAIGSWTAGPGEDVQIADANGTGPTGWVGMASRTNDAPRGDLPGSTSGRSVADAGTGRVPLLVAPTDPADVWDTYEALRGVWRSSTDADVPIVMGDPRGTQRTYYGRPDGINGEDLTCAVDGIIACLVTYRLLDPYGYGDEVTVADPAGTITAAGTVDTERLVVTVTGTGGTPSVTNPANGTYLHWAGQLASGQTRVVDCRARTVTNAGVSAMGELAVAQEWLALSPGSNALTVTGCTIAVTYRPAYA